MDDLHNGHGPDDGPIPGPSRDKEADVASSASAVLDEAATTKLGPRQAHSIEMLTYSGEHQMDSIIELIEKELSEPYIVYTYRYFVNQWPNLCFLAYARFSEVADAKVLSEEARKPYPVGVIVCKLDRHLKGSRLMRGYIAMISVRDAWRGRGLAKQLVQRALDEMIKGGAQEIVLETEADNQAALSLYASLGFLREKRLHRFYLNGKDSFRLVLPISPERQVPPPSHEYMMPSNALIQPPNMFITDTSNQRTHSPANDLIM
ncbi:acyl-CoA N-acyltransferase [Testicularia cyperi]|uniref:Acyl-CoA N-acyltransferase n=1 Tax=Testicularia cyperi TaxID=1882483 RepID=A0A317XQK6_9BASI|nr:acyl-CoA N-acyltransferase [Testicularia cyperi]